MEIINSLPNQGITQQQETQQVSANLQENQIEKDQQSIINNKSLDTGNTQIEVNTNMNIQPIVQVIFKLIFYNRF